MKRFIKDHRKFTAAITTLLIVSATALAYYLTSITISGEGESAPSKSSLVLNEVLTVTPPTGLLPTNGKAGNKPIVDTFKPTTEHVLNAGAKLAVVITTSNEATCKASWFAVEAKTGTMAAELLEGTKETTKPYTYLAGTDTAVDGLEEHFISEGSENQSGCETAKVKVKLTLTGSGT